MTDDQAITHARDTATKLTIPRHLRDDVFQLAALTAIQCLRSCQKRKILPAKWIIERRVRDRAIEYIKKDWANRQHLSSDGVIQDNAVQEQKEQMHPAIEKLLSICTPNEGKKLRAYLAGRDVLNTDTLLAVLGKYREKYGGIGIPPMGPILER